jgi:hypothetical protein
MVLPSTAGWQTNRLRDEAEMEHMAVSRIKTGTAIKGERYASDLKQLACS